MAAVETRRSERARGAAVREALVGYGFVLVPMAVFIAFFIYPIGYAFYISFFDWGILGKFESVGLDNYLLLLHDHLSRSTLNNSLS